MVWYRYNKDKAHKNSYFESLPEHPIKLLQKQFMASGGKPVQLIDFFSSIKLRFDKLKIYILAVNFTTDFRYAFKVS